MIITGLSEQQIQYLKEMINEHIKELEADIAGWKHAIERLDGSPDTSKSDTSKGDAQEEGAPELTSTPPKLKHATHTPIVGRGYSLAIREGPLKDLLELETVNAATARPVIRDWYPLVTKSTANNYADQYVKWMRSMGLIDQNGKPAASSTPESVLKARTRAKKEEPPVEGGQKATDTPIVGRTRTLAIREGPLRELMALEVVTPDEAQKIIRKWYPSITDTSVLDYAYRYLKWMRAEGRVDKDDKPIKAAQESNEVGQAMYDEQVGRNRNKDEGPKSPAPPETEAGKEEAEETDLVHPARKDLTVVAIKNDVEIYLEPLNELLKLPSIDDAALEKVLNKYYEVSRPSFQVAIRETWKQFLEDDKLVDEHGQPTCQEVEI